MKKRNDAFTLVELLITIGILIIIAGIAVPQVVNYINRSKSARAKMDMSTISTAVKCFYTDWGKYPVSLADLKGEETLHDPLNVSTSFTITGLPGGIDYLGSSIPLDIFSSSSSNNAYQYYVDTTNGQNFILWSIGPDKTSQITTAGINFTTKTLSVVLDGYDDIYESSCEFTLADSE